MIRLLQLLISPLVKAFQTVYKDGKINYNSLVTIIVLLTVLGGFGYHEYSKVDEDKHIELTKETVLMLLSDTDVQDLLDMPDSGDSGDTDE